MRVLHFPEFEIHQLQGYIQAIFLVIYPKKMLLLDGLSRPDFWILKQYIENELKRKVTDLRVVVVTHMHPDHAGAVTALRTNFDTAVVASEHADAWYRGFSGVVQHLSDIMMGQFVALRKKTPLQRLLYKRKVSPDFFSKHKMSIPEFSDWQILNTPGHTDHDLSVYHAKYKVLYVADVVLRIREKYLLPFPITLPSVMTSTLNLLKGVDIKTLLMAHGGIAQEKHFDAIFNDLHVKVFSTPSSTFRWMKYFVNITKAIERAKNRFDSLE